MPRLRNSVTGVVVNVDEVTAEQLGADWSPTAGKAESAEPQEPKEAPRRGRPRQSDK